MFAISLSPCSRYNANFKLDQSVLAIHDSPLYYEVSEEDHPRTVSHVHDYWWTLEFANAFVSLGVNSLAELVPSHAASRRWLVDKMHDVPSFIFMKTFKMFQQQSRNWFRSNAHEQHTTDNGRVLK
jgi:hypothetical protein